MLRHLPKSRATILIEQQRHVRLFRNGRDQLEPVRKDRLLALLDSLEPVNEPFPNIDEDLPPLDDVNI